MLASMWSNGNSHPLLAGMHHRAGPRGDGLVVSYKTTHSSDDPVMMLPGNVPKELKIYVLPKTFTQTSTAAVFITINT